MAKTDGRPPTADHQEPSVVRRLRSGWRERATLLAILLLAFALRLYNIEAQSIWGDEAFSIFVASHPVDFILSGGTDTHPPLYHLWLHFWMLLAGRTPLAVRFLSVVWSMVSVAAGYALAKLLTADRRRQTADLSAVGGLPSAVTFLVAISPFHIFYAQETRMYAQVAALCALSLVFFLKWRSEVGGWRLGVGSWKLEVRMYGIAWFITTLLAIYSHYFAFFVLAAEDIFVVATSVARDRRLKSSLRPVVVAQLLLALLYLPWIIIQADYLLSRRNARESTLSLAGAWDVISQGLGALFIGTTIEGVAQMAAALFCLALAISGYVNDRKAPFTNLLALAVGVPICGAIIANPFLPHFRERFLLLASPPFVILMASGIGAVASWMSHASHVTFHASLLFLVVLLAFICLFALNNYWFDPQYRKGEYALAIAAIRAQAQPSDAVIIYSPIQDGLYDYYHMDGLTAYALPKADLSAISANHPRAWLLLYGDPAVYDPDHSAENFLSAHGFKSFYQSYRDGALARYDFARGDQTVQNTHIQFGDAIVLRGYSLPSAATRGGTLPITLQWQTRAPLAENYTVFVHLLSPDGAQRVVAQMDTQPVGGTRPTRTWAVGETIRDNIGVAIPANVPAGLYQVEVGMYWLQTLQRLPIGDAAGLRVQDGALIIGEVQIGN